MSLQHLLVISVKVLTLILKRSGDPRTEPTKLHDIITTFAWVHADTHQVKTLSECGAGASGEYSNEPTPNNCQEQPKAAQAKKAALVCRSYKTQRDTAGIYHGQTL